MTTEDINLPIGIPLDRFIQERQSQFPFASGELSQLLRDIALAGKIVNLEISRSGLNDIEGAYGSKNVQGEDQQKLDVIANERFINALTKGGEVCAIISEEEDTIRELESSKGKYIIAIDPLDGSSNIDVNVSIGTIFSVYRRKSNIGEKVTMDDVLQRGEEQVAAGYLIYGSSCMLVYTTGYGVNGFTYEPSLGEFFLSHTNLKTPEEGKYYSINEGSYFSFEAGVKAFVDECKQNKVSARYIGSLVADFHRNMLKGGIYIYPKTESAPNGKLRLCYECNALAFLIEQAGGRATDGENRILEIQPTTLHQRVPFFIGSEKMVLRAESLLVGQEEVI
ncbi:class 1 fructose-bisphosphatase [Aureibacter tunicatorum]|uniref:Fructose-1,6-bisphosphatase class 1 n=1 Tax=Aureibacter tunicatorum TaxID=866807 RepID=A0AAE3XQS1_9BACT|nr:class 1 fructose-bisphosphatase [Aureibacter tunicatorum]MDR6241038.1 fructose-1,6-bisphosphatase I [Aureibacter tunicatorum]BDD03816.1 fructose-1,6-bisphosphatase class 1 [Aureibacter tunicatorum]